MRKRQFARGPVEFGMYAPCITGAARAVECFRAQAIAADFAAAGDPARTALQQGKYTDGLCFADGLIAAVADLKRFLHHGDRRTIHRQIVLGLHRLGWCDRGKGRQCREQQQGEEFFKHQRRAR
jgi:hypothetical protein